MKKQTRTFSTKFINQNFRIKVFGRTEDGQKINTLMGVSGIIAMIGEELFYKFIQRALDCMLDVCVCKLRRGLQVSLYSLLKNNATILSRNNHLQFPHKTTPYTPWQTQLTYNKSEEFAMPDFYNIR